MCEKEERTYQRKLIRPLLCIVDQGTASETALVIDKDFWERTDVKSSFGVVRMGFAMRQISHLQEFSEKRLYDLEDSFDATKLSRVVLQSSYIDFESIWRLLYLLL